MLAITLQSLLLVYHQLTTLVDLYPFNGVRFTKRTERVAEAAVNFTLMSLPILGFAARIESLMKYAVAYYFILFAVECATWWLPYFVGASPKWKEIYLRVHSTTLGILPGRDRRPAPNVEHLILMLITSVTAIATFKRFHSDHPSGYPRVWIPVLIGIAIFLATAAQHAAKTGGVGER